MCEFSDFYNTSSITETKQVDKLGCFDLVVEKTGLN